jgi:hypothetical protein
MALPVTPSIPLALPVANGAPIASPVSPVPPIAAATDLAVHTGSARDQSGAAAGTAELQFDDAGAGSATRFKRSSKRRKPRSLWVIALGSVSVCGLLIGCGGVVAGAAWLLGLSPANLVPDFSGKSWEWPQGNCTFRSPGDSWKHDKDLQVKLKLYHAMKRAQPDNNLALHFRDYKTRSPSEAELREETLSRLRSFLPESLETEMKDASDATTLGSHPARVLLFAGLDEHSVLMNGECYMLACQGYGYWFFTWGPASEREAVEPEWQRARQGFTLGNMRSGWQETPRETEIARCSAGSKIRYELRPVKGLWKREPLDIVETRALYGKADLVLVGTYPGEPKSQVKASSSATAQVVILDDKKGVGLGDAVKAARDYLLERQKDKRDGGDYTYPNTKIDLVQDKSIRNIDDPFGAGLVQGQVQKLLVENDQARYRYVVLRVVNHAQGVVVVWLECDNRYRDYWDPELMALLETLQIQPAAK